MTGNCFNESATLSAAASRKTTPIPSDLCHYAAADRARKASRTRPLKRSGSSCSGIILQ